MAHGDYDCCAICDSKMRYNAGDAKTKDSFCQTCLENIINLTQEPTVSINNFLLWLSKQPVKERSGILDKLGYRPCFYESCFDDDIAKLINPESITHKGGEDGKK